MPVIDVVDRVLFVDDGWHDHETPPEEWTRRAALVSQYDTSPEPEKENG